MIKLEVQDNKKAVKAAVKKAASTKKALLPIEEVWENIFRMKNTVSDTSRLKVVKELMEAGKVGRDPAKVGKNLSKTEAMAIYSNNQALAKLWGLKEYFEKDLELYPLINTQELMDEFLEGFYKATIKLLSLDTETEGYSGGVDVYRERLAGWSATYYKDDGTEVNGYVPILHKAVDEATGEIMDVLDERNCSEDIAIAGLKRFAELAEETIWHNASFDLHICRNTHGIEFKGIVHDTIVMMKLLDENLLSYKLKDLATKYLHMPSDTFEAMFGKDAKFCEVPIMVARWYAAKDTKITFALYKFIMSYMNKPELAKVKKVYERIECPIIKITFEMEAVGFAINMPVVQQQLKEGRIEIAELEVKLKEIFGDINLGSWQQLQKALYYDRDMSRHILGKTIHKGESIKPDKNYYKPVGKAVPKAAITTLDSKGKAIQITPYNNIEEYNDTVGWIRMASGEIQLGKFKELPDGKMLWERAREKLPTDSKALKKLSAYDEGLEALQAYRDITKHIGSFVEKMEELISPDERLHGSFNQLGTVTGRYSSRGPNLQNQPYKARRFYIAPEGRLILSGDFS